MNRHLVFVTADPEDHIMLTETAKAAKQYWGYSDDLMELWRSDLEISAAYILENRVVKVYDSSAFTGFFALKKATDGKIEIDHLWLLPNFIRKGYGRQIFQYLTEELISAGYSEARLLAEPHAKGFYDRMGGVVKGKYQSKISGRELDIYVFNFGGSG